MLKKCSVNGRLIIEANITLQCRNALYNCTVRVIIELLPPSFSQLLVAGNTTNVK
jgi:hypothetical protein